MQAGWNGWLNVGCAGQNKPVCFDGSFWDTCYTLVPNSEFSGRLLLLQELVIAPFQGFEHRVHHKFPGRCPWLIFVAHSGLALPAWVQHGKPGIHYFVPTGHGVPWPRFCLPTFRP